MNEFKTIEQITDTIFINYYKFNGIAFVAERDFVLLDNFMLDEKRGLLVFANRSIDYEYPIPKGVVRG